MIFPKMIVKSTKKMLFRQRNTLSVRTRIIQYLSKNVSGPKERQRKDYAVLFLVIQS